ncbi:MAG: hypothetical protein IH945_02230 [Armatimonadetes bacterium]|nr:hypothetical protein [Armatimonadota bacterium]
MARKKHSRTRRNRELAHTLAAFGIPQEDIAGAIGIAATTLRRHYRRELDLGTIEANVAIAQALFKQATEGDDVRAMIFWLKCRAGWSETTRVEHPGRIEGGATDEERIERIAAILETARDRRDAADSPPSERDGRQGRRSGDSPLRVAS